MQIVSFAVALALLGGDASAPLSAWFVPAAAKVMRDARPAAADAWDLALAANEVEACQIVLSSDHPVDGVTVSVTLPDAARASGALEASLFQVMYVPIGKEKMPFPDPLPPLAGPLALRPGQAQPVWISVRARRDAPAGAYEAGVEVRAGEWTRRLRLGIRVWDFALPETPSCVTAVGNGTDLAEWHGVKSGSPEALALSRKYYEFLLAHRVSPMFIPVDLMTDAAVPYLDDPRMTSFTIPYPKSDEELKALVARLIDGGWFAKGYFYVVDEPSSKQSYDAFVAATDRLRKIEPRYRIVMPFYRNPEFGEKLRAIDLMLGRLNVWCPHLLFVESEPGLRKFLRGRANAGESVWWYVCNNPRGAYNNLQIDMCGMSHRALPWQQKREGIAGLLYWSAMAWWKQYIDDPWENMDTLRVGIYGDGSLLYPGKKVGIDGPVGSIRLELFRDGVEDFDCLTLADRWLGPEATARFVARVARTPTDWERDPVRFEAVRRELGAALEKAAASPRGR